MGKCKSDCLVYCYLSFHFVFIFFYYQRPNCCTSPFLKPNTLIMSLFLCNVNVIFSLFIIWIVCPFFPLTFLIEKMTHTALIYYKHQQYRKLIKSWCSYHQSLYQISNLFVAEIFLLIIKWNDWCSAPICFLHCWQLQKKHQNYDFWLL